VQSRASGAEIELVPGSRQDCADEALRQAADIFYASHNWHPFFLHGTKTLAYELWEDLGFVAPDNVIVPCGAGSNVLGCGIGFAELQRAGEIKKLPRIFAAQPENCAPIARAFLKQPAVAAVPTIAEGTAIAQPIRTPEVLAVLHESQGGAVMLSEAEIGAATLDLARTGIYVEPTCAQAAAAFVKLLEAGTIRADGRKLHPAYLFEVKKPEESRGVFDYYKLLQTTAADDAFRPIADGGCAFVRS
jgi:threonine synthase